MKILKILKKLNRELNRGDVFSIVKDKLQRRGKNADIRIAYYGYWQKNDTVFTTLVARLSHKQVAISWYKPSLIICSVFGIYAVLNVLLKTSKTPSLFFSGENLRCGYLKYSNYMDGLPTLSLGFDDNAPHSLRFPLWLLSFFSPEFIASASLDDITIKLAEAEKNKFLRKYKFASLIARHGGTSKWSHSCQKLSRLSIVKDINTISQVSCAGQFLHNDDSLIKDFNDIKTDYLKDFIFNICPENSSTTGYVTEKIFDAIKAGCIPVYWGDENPEPDILNQKRIIFWESNGDNRKNIKLIKTLWNDQKIREEFLHQDIFLPKANLLINNYFLMLRENILDLLNR